MNNILTIYDNFINSAIRLGEPYQTILSILFMWLTLVFFRLAIKKQAKDKPGLKAGWVVLAILSFLLSILYLIY